MLWVLIGVAAGCGAIARYVISMLALRVASQPAFGTAVVNVTGSLLAGALGAAGANTLAQLGASPDAAAQLILAGGFLGSFTTMSTAMVETAQTRRPWNFARLILEPLSSVGAAALGWFTVVTMA